MTNEIRLQVDYLERQRKKILQRDPKVNDKSIDNNFIKLFLVAVAMFALFWFTKWIPFLVGFAGIIVYVVITSNMREKKKEKLNTSLAKFKSFYKNEIILPLLKEVDGDVKYSKNGSILQKHNEFNLNNVVGAEDLVQMHIKGVNIDFGEIITQSKDQESGEIIRSKTSMCVAEFNKNFKSPTFVFRGNATMGKALSHILPRKAKQMLKNSDMLPSKHIILDDPVFNDNFMVFTDDDIDARFILTHTMMERLVKLGTDFPFAMFMFINNKIIFNTSNGVDMSSEKTYDYDLFDYVIDDTIPNQTKTHEKVINGVISVIDTLELDSNIWK